MKTALESAASLLHTARVHSYHAAIEMSTRTLTAFRGIARHETLRRAQDGFVKRVYADTKSGPVQLDVTAFGIPGHTVVDIHIDGELLGRMFDAPKHALCGALVRSILAAGETTKGRILAEIPLGVDRVEQYVQLFVQAVNMRYQIEIETSCIKPTQDRRSWSYLFRTGKWQGTLTMTALDDALGIELRMRIGKRSEMVLGYVEAPLEKPLLPPLLVLGKQLDACLSHGLPEGVLP